MCKGKLAGQVVTIKGQRKWPSYKFSHSNSESCKDCKNHFDNEEISVWGGYAEILKKFSQ